MVIISLVSPHYQVAAEYFTARMGSLSVGPMTRSTRKPNDDRRTYATVIAFGPLSTSAQNAVKPHRSLPSAYSLSFGDWR
jgi:hypothetical protein